MRLCDALCNKKLINRMIINLGNITFDMKF